MKKISHIGIAVSDLDYSSKLFSRILQKEYSLEEVAEEAITTSFFSIGETKIELIAANNETSVISKYLAKHKEGMHHIAIEVDDIQEEISRLKGEGIRVLNENPRKGADNKLISFLHPKDTNGVLFEICQSIPG